MTDFNYAQRRRLAIAAAITAIAVPFVFVIGDGDGEPAETAPTVTVVGEARLPGETSTAADDLEGASAATDAMGTPPVAYLEGSPQVQQEPATIAVPRVGESVKGTASFRRNLRSRTLCQAKTAPFNSTIQVTNLDNGLSVRCINSVGGAEPVADVVLHADAFVLIADLTDAPVPVEISW